MRSSKDLISPLPLKVWGWQAIFNFFLGGSASGMYLIALWITSVDSGAATPLLARLLPPMLAGLGFFIVAFEAGHPLRAPYLPINIRSSWMSREIVIGGLFIILATIDAFFHSPLYATFAGATALGLMVSQGFIVYRSIAVKAWNMPLIPVLFLTSGLWSGFWLVLMVYSPTAFVMDTFFLAIGLIFAGADVLVWTTYVKLKRDIMSGDRSRRLLRSMLFTTTTVIGYLIPMSTIVMIMAMAGSGIPDALAHIFVFLVGLLVLTGNLLQKTEVIYGDNVLRGIAMGQPKGRR